MKVSAASSSNDTLCHLKSHNRFKSVFLNENMTVEFEQEQLHFQYAQRWQLTHRNKTWILKADCPLEFQINDFCTISIELFTWKTKWHSSSFIPFQHKLVIGSSIACDGIVDACFPLKMIELVKQDDKVSYKILSGKKCAVNGKIADECGCVCIPSLIQIDKLSVFLCAEYAVFNCAAVIGDDDQILHHPDAFEPEYNMPRYLQAYQHHELSLIEPEFLALPSVRGISVFTMGPMLTMSCASLISAYLSYQASGNQNVLIMPVMMLISSLFWPLMNALYDGIKLHILKKRRRTQYIKECRHLMDETVKTKQLMRQSLVYPEQMNFYEIWQIRQGHFQFLKVPLGIGEMQTDWTLKPASKTPDVSETECLKMKAELFKQLSCIDDVLVSCDLNVHPHIAFLCHQSILKDVLLSVIVRMGMLMDINEVCYVLFCEDESISWDLRTTELFHFENKNLIIDETVSLDQVESLLHQIEFKPIIAFSLGSRRILKLSESTRKKMKIIYFLDLAQKIPKECSYVFHAGQNGCLKEGNLKLLDAAKTEEMKKMLMKLRRMNEMDSFQSSASFLPHDLSEQQIIEQWKTNSEPYAVLGKKQDGSLVVLNLSEHHEGPHGLVCGMTGSGKSVLLLDLLLSLAYHCSPENLQMLILDYKGGSLIQQLAFNGKVLPHLCGGLSNQTSMIHRALSSIQFEALNRQKCFLYASQISSRPVSNLSEYRLVQKNFSQLKNLAELVIVVDEFAELKREEPEFLKTLISLSRTGRSLGFHLILCTQKISGVVDDEIIGNSHFHIVLKTARASESRELAGTDAAASFKQPGEFLLHVDDVLNKGKAFNCLAPFEAVCKSEIHVTDSCGFIRKTAGSSGYEGIRQCEALIEALCLAADRLNLSSTPLWLEPLKAFDASKWLKKNQLFLGIGDFPEIREQNPVYLQLHQHLLIGYESEHQQKLILTFFIKQLLCLGVHTFFVQLVSAVDTFGFSIAAHSDQIRRFLQAMTSVQHQHTVIVIDDLQEFMEYFGSASALGSFIFRASQRRIQIVALCHKPFTISQHVMDQFERKMIFADLNDSECMQLFHLRKEGCRLHLKSQAYMEINEKIHAVQMGLLHRQLKERTQLQTIDYLDDVVKKPEHIKGVLGVNVQTLKHVQIQEGKWIASGISRSQLKDYCSLIELDALIVDHVELIELYTRKTIRDVNVLWIGPQFQYQNLFLVDPRQKVPSSFQEGMVIRHGTMELVRLYDE